MKTGKPFNQSLNNKNLTPIFDLSCQSGRDSPYLGWENICMFIWEVLTLPQGTRRHLQGTSSKMGWQEQ